MKQVNWGIIGCGNVTEEKSGPAFNRVEDSNLIAVMRRNAARAEDYAKRHGVPKWYADADQLIADPDINAVYIATPPDSHAYYAVKAAEAGKHVYVEKPMALNHGECLQMMDAAKKAGTKLFVAYYRRMLPSFTYVKKKLDAGKFGEPRVVNVRLFKPVYRKSKLKYGIPWRVKPEIAGGGLFVDLGSHQLDYLDYLLGPIVEVKSFVVNQAGLYDADDVVSATFRFESGVIGSGMWCFSAGITEPIDSIEILGSKGRVEFSTFGFRTMEIDTVDDHLNLEFRRPEHIQEPLIKTVVEDILGRGSCPSTGESAARTTAIIDKIYTR